MVAAANRRAEHRSTNRRLALLRYFDDLVVQAASQLEPVTLEQAQVARPAYRDYGRGSGHPARLKIGDCFAYALARTTPCCSRVMTSSTPTSCRRRRVSSPVLIDRP